jgi:site-specific recombinase XerD
LTAITRALTMGRMQQLELWRAIDRTHDAACARTASDVAASQSERGVAIERVGQSQLDALVVEYMLAARSKRTHAAYAGDWRLFERWCAEHGVRALPSSTATLVRYLVHLASSGRKASTIRRARIAIGVMHAQQGLERPDRDDRIRTLERGIGRIHGTRENGATPLLVPELARMLKTLGTTTRDERDRALLLLGFAGAFRPSDLVRLNVEDLEPTSSGLRVVLRRSKEDPLGQGSITEIPRAEHAELCPVNACTDWLARIGAAGPLFRVVYGPRVTLERLAPRAVSRAVQRAASRAGLPQVYSAHSLRSGLATSAHSQGCSDRDIQAHGRWKDLRSLNRYIHVSAAAARRTLAGVL